MIVERKGKYALIFFKLSKDPTALNTTHAGRVAKAHTRLKDQKNAEYVIFLRNQV